MHSRQYFAHLLHVDEITVRTASLWLLLLLYNWIEGMMPQGDIGWNTILVGLMPQ